MKNILTFAGVLVLTSLLAQEKHDYVWLLGANPNIAEQNLGGTRIDFNVSPIKLTYFDIPIDFLAIAMISDGKGDLMFYTNGCQVINRNHELMANGDKINPGIYHNLYCGNSINIGYPLMQGVLILPFPDRNGYYVLFHFRKEDFGEQKNLLHTLVNMNTSDGLGIIEKTKNQHLLTDFIADMLTAVRHGNGRDWWVVAPKTDSEDGHLFLLTPKGIEGPYLRKVGEYWNTGGANGQAAFSPDGTMYARMHRSNGLHIADFDRCTGQFDNFREITFPQDTITGAGVAFSPNSRFLYASATQKVYQFDTWAGNISASKQIVAIYDGFQSPFPTLFFQQMLAPDNKIYITSPNDNNILHTIHNPNKPGQLCDFEQHGIILPTLHFASPPNFPHFRLYDLPDSPCDTLGIDGPTVSAPEPTPPAADLLHLYPNPAPDEVLVSLHQPMEGRWHLVAPSGQVVRTGHWAATQTTQRIDVSQLSAGVYFFRFVAESGRVVTTRKMVVAR